MSEAVTESRRGWKRRFTQVLSHRLLPLWIGLLGMVLCLPSLGGGLVIDDWFHRARMIGGSTFPVMDHPLLEFYSMIPREGAYAESLRPLLAWWAAPNLEITFLRPLSIATHVLDYALWPDNPVLHHLHSVIWYGLAVAAIAWTMRQVSTIPAVAGLAALLFAVEDAHGMPAGWIANRNSLVTLAFGALALGFHSRWRRGLGRWNGVGATLALALALSAGESALGIVAYLVAWEVFLAKDAIPRRIVSILPTVGTVIAWRAIYASLGYRTLGSGLYIDPIHDPIAFTRAALERMPILLLSQWTQVQVDFVLAFPRSLQLTFTVLGCAVILILLLIFGRTLQREAEARFWALGMVLALVPVCATFPMDRLLTFVGVGTFGLLAVQVHQLGWLGGSGTEHPGRWVRGVTACLLGLHLVLAAPFLAFRAWSPRLMYGMVEDSTWIVPPDEPVADETWVVVNGFDLFAMYMPIIRSMTGRTVPRSTVMLCSMMADIDIERPDARTLVLRPEGGFLANDLDRLVRARDIPFEVGQIIRKPTMEAEILEITEDGRPAGVAFHFDVPLEDPTLRWFQAMGLLGGDFVPPPVGGTIHIESITAGVGGF